MKAKIVLAALLLVALVNQSFTVLNQSIPVIIGREISIGNFKKLISNKNINVVLVPSNNPVTVTVTGDEKYLNSIMVSIDNETMTISSSKNLSGKKITVYIPVKDISYLEVSEDAHVSSQGSLVCPELSVIVSEGGFVELKNLGHIDINPRNCEFTYQKNEVSRIVFSSN